MAFWSSWFKPTCAVCAQKITGDLIQHDDQVICATCDTKQREAEAQKAAEVEARRAAEEAARARLEDRRRFGTDPRYDEDR